MVDLVDEVLGFIDSNWSTSNYDPQPNLIHRDDSTYYPSGDRVRTEYDLVEGAVVSVASSPLTTREPLDLYYNAKVDDAVDVRLEAAHEEQHGDIADVAEWTSLKDELTRTIWLEREWPVRSAGFHTLVLNEEDDQSHRHADYFRADFTVGFTGYKDLP